MKKEDIEEILTLVNILKNESEPVAGHTDIPAYRFCWTDLMEKINKL